MKTIAINIALFGLGVGTGYWLHASSDSTTTSSPVETVIVNQQVQTSIEDAYADTSSQSQPQPYTTSTAITETEELPQTCNDFIDNTIQQLIENQENRSELSLPEECQEQSELVINTIQDAMFNHSQLQAERSRGDSNTATQEQRPNNNRRQKVELSPEQQVIHDEWQAGQKEHIGQVLASIAPEQLANRMSRRIGRRSPFLNDVEYKVDAYDDEAWAYQQEQLLYSIISGHPNSAEFTLSSLSCHQMMCEIIGISTTVTGWNRIFQTIRQEAPGYKGFARNQGRGAAIRYTDPELDQSYMYTVLQFEAESPEQDVEG